MQHKEEVMGPRRLVWLGVGLWAAMLLSACSSKPATSTSASSTATSPGSPSATVSASATPTPTATSVAPSPPPKAKGTPTPAPTPARTTPAASPPPQAVVVNGTVAVADANDGQTVTLHPGDHLRVALASTYWQIQPSSDPAVLRADGSPATSPSPGCVPGAGCGTAAATFIAVAPGHATVVATRTSCGEAMLCQGAAGRYQVQVVVAS
jgi:cytoskeletal protein RodZ